MHARHGTADPPWTVKSFRLADIVLPCPTTCGCSSAPTRSPPPGWTAQEDTLNGGIVLRRFEDYRTAETRVWWVDGVPVLTTAHPDSPAPQAEPDLTAVAPLVAALACPFITTDLALRADGEWRVVEVGDGQVSDLPAGADPTALFQCLKAPMTIDAVPRCPQCSRAGTPILFGLPTPEARLAEADGAVVLRGCIVPEARPHWTCEAGHDWATEEARWGAQIDAVISEYERS